MTTTFVLLTALLAFQADPSGEGAAGMPAGIAGDTDPHAADADPDTEEDADAGIDELGEEEEESPALRRWRSKDGKSSIVGEYVEFKDGRVVIKRQPDDKIIRVKPTDLEDVDMQWVREQVKLKRTSRPSKYACVRCRDTEIVDCPVKNCRGGKLFTKVDVPTYMDTPLGPVVHVHSRLAPTSVCRACAGRGQIACPQCTAKNYQNAAEEAEYEQALREKAAKARRDRDAKLAELLDTNRKLELEVQRIRLEREKKAVEGSEESGMGEQEAALREANRKLQEEVKAAELERKRREFEKDKGASGEPRKPAGSVKPPKR